MSSTTYLSLLLKRKREMGFGRRRLSKEENLIRFLMNKSALMALRFKFSGCTKYLRQQDGERDIESDQRPCCW
jgi:hypothetical protein